MWCFSRSEPELVTSGIESMVVKVGELSILFSTKCSAQGLVIVDTLKMTKSLGIM